MVVSQIIQNCPAPPHVIGPSHFLGLGRDLSRSQQMLNRHTSVLSSDTIGRYMAGF